MLDILLKKIRCPVCNSKLSKDTCNENFTPFPAVKCRNNECKFKGYFGSMLGKRQYYLHYNEYGDHNSIKIE